MVYNKCFVILLLCSSWALAEEVTTGIPETLEEEETTVIASSEEDKVAKVVTAFNTTGDVTLGKGSLILSKLLHTNASEQNSILSLHDRVIAHIREFIPDFEDDLDTWEAPPEFQISFPYYLSGYDDEDRPIWISECGKYDARPLLDKGGKQAVAVMDKFMAQVAYRMIRSIFEKGATQGVGLMDFDGLQVSQFIHPPTLAFLLRSARTYYHLILKHMGGVLVVNANYPTEVLVNILRPVLGPVLEKVDIHGNEKSKWIPYVKRMFPHNTVPSWYGGSKTFKPLEVYG